MCKQPIQKQLFQAIKLKFFFMQMKLIPSLLKNINVPGTVYDLSQWPIWCDNFKRNQYNIDG